MKKTLALILALALCLSLAACSGLTNEPTSDPSAAPSGDDAPAAENTDAPEASSDEYTPFVEVQGVDDTTIYVGNTAATTGSYATVGVPFNAGLEAAFKAYNDNGGFQGKSIELIHYDDGLRRRPGPHLHQDPGGDRPCLCDSRPLRHQHRRRDARLPQGDGRPHGLRRHRHRGALSGGRNRQRQGHLPRAAHL